MSRTRLVSVVLVAVALFASACHPVDSGSLTAEVDELGYRRGKDLLRQGRNQEALAEFQKVLEKRGLANSPETHLELGLLYHQHIRDPIAAIYHYKRFRELKPNAQQADLVRQRIDAATRDFARTLPGQPLETAAGPADYADLIQRLQRENEQLRMALGAARVAAGFSPKPPVDERGNISGLAPEETPALPAEDNSLVTAAPAPDSHGEVPATEDAAAVDAGNPVAASPATDTVRPDLSTGRIQFPTTAAALAPTPRPAVANATAPAAAKPTPAKGGRRHVVKAKDSLFSIARQYYGTASASKVEEIFQANRDQLRSRTDLKVGMELKLP
ncbi:LysM peptidoglycan-binding domain-containing protein [Nibricoccus sp. IMCC34717]|uniref:Cell division protein CpoB n=1 Tax=Nibricoccus sp. IMCC34717 TaxID=3034021 RepID=UPI00384C35E6